MTMLRPFVPPFFITLLLTACVAKDVGSLGDLEPCDDGSVATTGVSGESGESGEMCSEPEQYYEPASPGCEDPVDLVLPEAGCYEACNRVDDPCTVGVCTLVQTQLDTCNDAECCILILELCLGDTPDAVCSAVVGTTFASTEELECGLGPDGPVLCNWQITFEGDGSYLWQYSDIGQGGTYSCEDGVLTPDDPGLAATYDPATGILTWDGVEYLAEPE